MPQVKKIEILTIDEEKYAVADMSAEVQRMVELFNEWHQEEEDCRSAMMKVAAAKQVLSSQIIETIKKEKEAAEAPAEGDAAAAE